MRGSVAYHRSLSFKFCFSINPIESYMGSKEKGESIKRNKQKITLKVHFLERHITKNHVKNE